MNRYLSIPLVITLVGFSIAYMSRSSSGEPIVLLSNPTIATNEVGGAKANTNAKTSPKKNAKTITNTYASSVKPMTFEDVKVQILDGWPTTGVSHFAFRKRIFEPLYATMGPLAQVDRDGKPDPNVDAYFCSLSVFAHSLPEKGKGMLSKIHGIHGYGNSGHFAIHVDRYTKEIHVFADGKWQDYKAWQNVALAKYSQLTGWNQDAPKSK